MRSTSSTRPASLEDVPVTIAWGEHDRLVAPPKARAATARLALPGLEGCGHTPTWDDPELVARVLLGGQLGWPGGA